MVTPQSGRRARVAFALLTMLFVALCIQGARADPTGASILYNATAGAPSSSADSHAAARGTITTLVLSAVQQDQNWKAYVGNVTGRLSLDNAGGYTIYDWTLLGSVSGEVYVSRYSSPTFSSVTCANNGNITAEHPLYNMTNTQTDNINSTFNYTNHVSFQVGSQTIGANTCPSTATYVNDTRQSMNGTQYFQELILQDVSNRVVYATIISDNSPGYDLLTYDFQMIVPESDVNATATTYYFWTELSG